MKDKIDMKMDNERNDTIMDILTNMDNDEKDIRQWKTNM